MTISRKVFVRTVRRRTEERASCPGCVVQLRLPDVTAYYIRNWCDAGYRSARGVLVGNVVGKLAHHAAKLPERANSFRIYFRSDSSANELGMQLARLVQMNRKSLPAGELFEINCFVNTYNAMNEGGAVALHLIQLKHI